LDRNESVAVESANQFGLSLIINACQNNTEWYYKWTSSKIFNCTVAYKHTSQICNSCDVYKHTYQISLNM
jgi:hypothetical protein